MEQVNFEDVFADLIHSFESAADKIKKITDELEDEVYMRIANDRKAANGFRPLTARQVTKMWRCRNAAKNR